MARTSTRTPEQIERLVTGYKQSGLTRRQYCAQQGIAVATLDYYRLRRRKSATPPLVRVKLNNCRPQQPEQPKGFTLVLAKGRRIETGGQCNEQELARLIRIVEAA